MANLKAQEQKWQAEEDAHTMARYQEIMGDKARMGRAIKVAKQQAADLNKRAHFMQNAASMTKANSASSTRNTSTKGRKK